LATTLKYLFTLLNPL